ncbi:MAG TPA: hypothetical protein PLL41_08245 [Smithella sp.]|nr:hypothetical protein [Smithella sp.]
MTETIITTTVKDIADNNIAAARKHIEAGDFLKAWKAEMELANFQEAFYDQLADDDRDYIQSAINTICAEIKRAEDERAEAHGIAPLEGLYHEHIGDALRAHPYEEEILDYSDFFGNEDHNA